MKTIALTTATLLMIATVATANEVRFGCEVKPVVNAAGKTLYLNKVDPDCAFNVNGFVIEDLKDLKEEEAV